MESATPQQTEAKLEKHVHERTQELTQTNQLLLQEVNQRKKTLKALNRSNAILKAQQEASIDAILIVDENLKILSYNQRFIDIWQIPLEVVQTGEDQQVLQMAVEKTSFPEKFLAQVQYLYLHTQEISRDEVALKDQRTLDRYTAPVHSPTGDNYGRVWYFRDITERKITEATLEQSAAQLRQQATQLQQTLNELQNTQMQLIQSEKMSSLGQLVAGVAHEINNPVSFIHGNIIILKDYTQDLLRMIRLYQQRYPNNDPEVQALVKEIYLEFLMNDLEKILSSMKMGTKRIQEIVQSLRTFSRLDEASMKAVNIHEGIDSTLMIVQSRLNSTGERPQIELIKEYGNLPLIECYAGQLNQVFLNILVNAIDALEDSALKGRWVIKKHNLINNPRIYIRTQLLEPDQATICIADNGLGIPSETLKQIFNPFFTTKPVGQGTGMGLAISHQIITQRHGGSLECISQPGVGAEFIIRIPLQQIVSNLVH